MRCKKYVSNNEKLKLKAPEGGWGYMIAMATVISFLTTMMPTGSFGIVHGVFLRQFGNEAENTAIIIAVLNTTSFYMGLISNYFLKIYSRRIVCVVGSVIFFFGSFLTIFASSVQHILITYGFLQGIGFGLIMPAIFTSFNEYFIEKKSFMLGVTQTFIAIGTMCIPYSVQFFQDCYGFRGAFAILAALSLHSVVGAITLQPVKWHMKTTEVSSLELQDLHITLEINQHNTADYNTGSSKQNINENSYFKINLFYLWNRISEFIELSLLKEPRFVNIAVGLSLAFTSEIMFVWMLPMYLFHKKFEQSEVIFMTTSFMIADLIGRMLLSVFRIFSNVANRKIFLCGSILIATLRTAFALINNNNVIFAICILLGLIRCLIFTTVTLVLAEYSQSRFTAVFSLYQVICGTTILISGQLTGIIATRVSDDSWIIHFQTFLLLLCSSLWILEMFVRYYKSSK